MVIQKGMAKNLALLVFTLPNFIFWLKEGGLSMSRYFSHPLPSGFILIGFLKFFKTPHALEIRYVTRICFFV
jgi:hypothetical protein